MTFSCLFSPHTKINTPLSQKKATKYRWKIIHSDADDIVHYPQDPRSPGLPAFGPSWSLGWFLLPPWWASCAAWRTQRSTQHNTATISTKKKGTCAHLEYDLAFQLRGWRQLLGHLLDGLRQEFVSKHVLEDASHLTLLIQRAVLLYGQDHWVPEREAPPSKSTTTSRIRQVFLKRTYRQVVQRNQKHIGWVWFHPYSDVTKACSLMALTTSSNLILVVRVQPW